MRVKPLTTRHAVYLDGFRLIVRSLIAALVLWHRLRLNVVELNVESD